MEQALPLRADWLNFNRFRARAEHTVPMGPYRLLLCGKGARPSCCSMRPYIWHANSTISCSSQCVTQTRCRHR